ncbi:GNAT family N-acetyltransferase [Priestia koreensis]|uniref:GNAT family N-acetyltransferase n=1 Tax=Priestia koreensis TaxID=284581 RepID=UPI00203CD280|nr:GNAT family N-acetyltransferase [Priestia koreensis]MCM3003514.1 GNAT family N-acetyltransferase [Priestia koreensis]
MSTYSVTSNIPEVEAYRRLRVKAGLSPKSERAAEKGLSNTLYAVTIYEEDQLIAMGRVIGDGGCFLQIVDIAVHPQFQGKGLGKQVMSQLMTYVDEIAEIGTNVSLMADVPADQLYLKFGFEYAAPRSLGMWKTYK